MKQVNILMMGGKRCGKTTVLASMCAEINKALAGTSMSLDSDNEQTRVDLEKAKISIRQKVESFKTPLTRVEVDENPTSALKTYSFHLRIDNGGKIPFRIHDIPGEWLTDSHQKEVKALVKDCQVIIIAIDTPYLFSKMTSKGYGIYHEEYNKPLEIANFFKNSLSVDQIEDRMILFVPIKCERYYHLTNTPKLNVSKRNYMQELIDAIGCGYRDLLMFLRSTPELLNSCTVAITPILSAGGIDFVHFRTDSETGKITSLYQEPEFLREFEQGYSPKFCEQPMIYALIYILMQELRPQTQKKGSLFGQRGIFQGLNRTQMQAAVETLRKKLKRNTGNHPEDGFYFIQNPREL